MDQTLHSTGSLRVSLATSVPATTHLIYLPNLLSTNYQTPWTCLPAVSLQIGLFILNGATLPATVITDTVSLTDIIYH
jgi:hypothetical protein